MAQKENMITPKHHQAVDDLLFILFVVLVIGIVSWLFLGKADAYTMDELATAIGKAENSKTHPYGVMHHYKHTTPRQACLNTIKHQYRIWVFMRSTGYPKAFLPYLASVYAPVGASNDPSGLNRFWIHNVQYFLNRGGQYDKHG